MGVGKEEAVSSTQLSEFLTHRIMLSSLKDMNAKPRFLIPAPAPLLLLLLPPVPSLRIIEL